MSIRRIVFLCLFGLYQLFVFLMTIFIESKRDDLSFLFEMFQKIAWFKYGALVGVVFLIIEFFLYRIDSKKIPKE
jgi:hypothetical protein